MSEPTKKTTFGLSPRNQYMALGVLGAVLAGVLAYQMAGGEPKPAEPEAADAPGVAEAVPVTPVPVPAEPETIDCEPDLTRDPFVMAQLLKQMIEQENKPKSAQQQVKDGPDPAIVAEAQSLAIKGIMGDDRERIAYINGKPVKAGDTIEGFAVLEVRENGVVLRKEKTDVLLQMQ